jgi:hypothetical protein
MNECARFVHYPRHTALFDLVTSMPQRKRVTAAEASPGEPATVSTASRGGTRKKTGSAGPRTSAPQAKVPAKNATLKTSAARSRGTTALTAADPGSRTEPAPTTLPGGLSSGGIATSTVGVTAAASTVTLDPGLSVVEIGIPTVEPYTLGQVSLPLIWLSQPMVSEHNRLTILTNSGRDDWLPSPGDLIVVRAPATGGQLTVTVFGSPGQPLEAASIAVRRLTRGPSAVSPPPIAAAPSRATREKEVRLEVLAHIERRGDQRFPGVDWVGTRGSRLRVEGFVVRALGELTPSDIEYQVLRPDGSLSPWIPSPQFCGTRGRGVRITGFAVRLSSQLQGRASVEYSGSFFDSGISGPFKDGEVCRPPVAGDALEALNIRVIQHG